MGRKTTVWTNKRDCTRKYQDMAKKRETSREKLIFLKIAIRTNHIKAKMIRTNHIKGKINNPQQKRECRLYGQRAETVNYTRTCSKLAQKE